LGDLRQRHEGKTKFQITQLQKQLRSSKRSLTRQYGAFAHAFMFCIYFGAETSLRHYVKWLLKIFDINEKWNARHVFVKVCY